LAGASALEHLRQDIRKRADSDKILSPAWVILPVLGIGIAVTVAIFAIVVALSG
jgi:hypothetical protein